MDQIDDAFLAKEKDIASMLSSDQSWAVIDHFLPPEIISVLRQEALSLRQQGQFVTSQSERHGVTYEKNNVEAMQLDGGDQYFVAPRLHEYVVQAARTLPSILSDGVIDLDGTMAANKLAVCLGGGSSYDKHLDNGGRGDTRKLTCLLYLNDQEWEPKLGGEFRLWHEKKQEVEGGGGGGGGGGERGGGEERERERETVVVDIAPRGGRMIVFFSDDLVHAVMPSEASCEEEHRYALTVWLPTALGVSDIKEDKEKERRHWGEGSMTAFDVKEEDVIKI